ncbi:MAG: TetR/AcrR family transcriptional regulator [Planctomycetota bacterium]|nr:TetR/AcrR family transcriptional regulator [Planctomycetota bacterium]
MTQVGRPREFDEGVVLEAALDLFWSRGFEATSKRELLEATGLASQSLYNTFGDKRALYLRALRHYGDRRLAELERSLTGRGRARNRLIKLVRSWAAPACAESAKGCFICNSAAEFGVVDAEVGAIVSTVVEGTRHRYAAVITKAQSEGDLNRRLDPKTLAATLVCAADGVAILRRAGAAQGLIEDAVRGVLALLEG